MALPRVRTGRTVRWRGRGLEAQIRAIVDRQAAAARGDEGATLARPERVGRDAPAEGRQVSQGRT